MIAIYNSSKKISGQRVNFVRIHSHFGWWANINGKHYGGSLIDPYENNKEAFAILREQARGVIKSKIIKQ